jgi:hypothetical protein
MEQEMELKEIGVAKEKIDYQNVDWIDKFEDEFDYIRSVVDMASGALLEDWSPPETISIVLNKVPDALDELKGLIEGVWESIKASQKILGPRKEGGVVINGKDCGGCRFTLVCTGAALFAQIPSLQSMTFGDQGCPRDWKSLENLVSVLPYQSPTL